MKNNSINAILNPRQLENFCKVFDLEPSEIETNFDGWHKHVLMTKDKVFLFPRSPQYAKEVKQELSLYNEFSHLNSIVLPKLIKRVRDKKISYYEFGVVTRLKGVAFSTFEETIKLDQLRKFLTDLSEIITTWHKIPTAELPSVLSKPKKDQLKRITLKNWHKKALESETVEAAVDFIYALVERITPSGLLNRELNSGTEIKKKWSAAIKELAELKDVLVHADVHEDQVLVDPTTLEITAVLDWEVARIDNPLWDFNFGEWGLGIWKWTNNFATLRKEMWSKYLKSRNISLSTEEGLHLFFTLWEITWLVLQKKKERIPITGTDFDKSVKIYLNKLKEIMPLLK